MGCAIEMGRMVSEMRPKMAPHTSSMSPVRHCRDCKYCHSTLRRRESSGNAWTPAFWKPVSAGRQRGSARRGYTGSACAGEQEMRLGQCVDDKSCERQARRRHPRPPPPAFNQPLSEAHPRLPPFVQSTLFSTALLF
mmetsp:Transcript_10924/g.33690  ORF Transcript_10924/g.33690 Transcript_10924/m.33690 type:complete len:137 (+) Transcript_10924:1555-1965(+)